MAIAVKLLAVISWYLFTAICQSLNVDDYSVQLSNKGQVETARNEVRNEVKIWTCPVEHSAGYLSESEKWNVFLNSLYCKFSEYEIQNYKRTYDVADIENWGNPDAIPNDEQGIEIGKDNFQNFLNKIQQFNITEMDSIRKITIEEPQLEELNHILNLTIKQGFHISCKEPHMIIKGDYIIMSHVNKSIVTGDIEKNCKDLLEADRLKFLNIFALNTIFLDADITTIHKLKNLTVIAPKWQVIGTRMIDFRGKNGGPLSQRIAKDLSTFNGADGRPGMAGGPGGNFFGIGEEFLNGENLQILVNGGKGGPGENGGNGKNGNNGTTPTKPTAYNDCDNNLCDNNKRINTYKCKELDCKTTASGTVVHVNCDYKIFGEDGKIGGNGGNGGKGGIGGYSGKIDLVELNSSSKILQFHSSGQNGIDGRGGIAGHGGKNGDDIVVHCYVSWVFGSAGWPEWTLKDSIRSVEDALSGKNGSDGENSKDIPAPKEVNTISKVDEAKIINLYKSYLRENLNDPFKYNFLMKFLKKLDDNNKVKNVYDTLGLADELRSLEEQFNMLIKNIDLRPFYQSLLSRISEYAKNFTMNVHSSLYKKVLGYLYTTTLGRLYNLEEDLESNLIIDISKYLDAVKKDIQKLKDSHDAKTKEELINKYKEEYKKEIDAKIKEATDIISNDIIPEIDNIAAQTNAHIDSLLDEVVKLQQEAKKNHTELIKKKKELERLLMLQNLISGLKVFGSVLGFLGPVGAAAGSVIGIGGTITETFIFNTPGSLTHAVPLKQTVTDLETLKGQIDKIRDKKVDNLKKSLESISQEANKYPDTFSDISVKVTNFRSRLDKISGEKISSYHLKEVENMEIELKATLRTKEKESSSATDQKDEKKKREYVAIQNMQKAVQLSSSVLDAYNKHIANQAKLDAIDDAIQKNEQNFHTLKRFEDEIYTTIMPMLQTIQTDIDSIVNNIEKKSKLVLDVAKWKAKSTLKDIKTQMQELTGQFKVNGPLIQSIEKMKEAIVSLIDVHEHIQDYQKEQTFANFIADINSVTVSNTPLILNMDLNSELKHILNELQITLTSSIVVQRYKVAIGALKQFVFPFADMYLRDLVLPTHLEFDPRKGEITLENLIFTVVTEIEKIKSKLDEYKQTVTKGDVCKGNGIFSSDYKYTEPFFVWERSKHKKMISKLLSGENVTVIADIMHSALDKDAIKFNVINFHFKSGNKKFQSKIDNALKGFQITATHLGNSYYRYNNKIYLMTTPIRDIWYYFQTDDNGEPVHKSDAYDKIKKGDFMLSPYATWRIRLDTITDRISFGRLKKLKGRIHLELAGHGHYVTKRDWYCANLNVDKYYKAVDKYIIEK